MALCPHCHHALPDPAPSSCANCGGDARPVAVAPPPPALGASPSGPAPPGWPSSPPPAPGWPSPPPPPLDWPSPPAPGDAPPVSGPAGSGPAPAGIPWEERDRIGLLAALVETTRQVLARPGEFFRAMPVGGGLSGPLLYAVLAGWLGIVASAFYSTLFRSIVGSSLGALGGEAAELLPVLAFLESWKGFGVQVVLGPAIVAVFTFVWAGLVHASLLLLGGGRQGFAGTFGVACYSQAFAVFSVFPFCGTLLVAPYALALWVVGLAAVHGSGEGRGYAAVVLAVVVPCCCLAALFVVLAGIAGLAGLGGVVSP